jgi:hypothetical protein
MIPRHPRQGTPLAPDQIFSAGYRDGMHSRAPHPHFQHNLDYLKGYVEGCRATPDRHALINFWQSRSLDSALQAIQLWEKDRERFGMGTVALAYHNDWWLVLVSKALHDQALPF